MENKIQIIIPVHKFDEETEKYLKDALESVPESDKVSCTISTTVENKENASKYGVNVCANTNKSTYQALVNQAVSTDYKYFTILELDDILSKNWLRNALTYIETMPEVSAYLTINDVMDDKTGQYVRGMNEMAWWEGMSSDGEEPGYITHDKLQSYYDYSMGGCVFNTEDFINIGMLKESINVFFWFEYLLRATNKDEQKLFVVPKIGYIHVVNRDGSLMEEWSKIPQDEIKEWRNLAKREYFFKEDRGNTID